MSRMSDILLPRLRDFALRKLDTVDDIFSENLIKKFHRAKVVGTADSILGMLFGIVKGGVLIYLLMTVLILTAACGTF